MVLLGSGDSSFITTRKTGSIVMKTRILILLVSLLLGMSVEAGSANMDKALRLAAANNDMAGVEKALKGGG